MSNKSTKRVFLGGTCNGSIWRDKITPRLNCEVFNPVVKDWTDARQENERKAREECDIVLYVITPKMTGTYSIAEVVDDSNKRPQKTVFCVLQSDDEDTFSMTQWKSLREVSRMVSANGGISFNSLLDTVDYINQSVV